MKTAKIGKDFVIFVSCFFAVICFVPQFSYRENTNQIQKSFIAIEI